MKRESLPNPYVRYEQLKRDWIAAHPEATADEYQAAMQKIAREAGV